MNILKTIVWIVVIAAVVWVGYIVFTKSSSETPAAEQGASAVETLGGGIEASAEASGTITPAPAPAVTPAPAPAPATTPAPAPAPSY